jgi:uncharacterized protein YcfJ
MNITTLAFSRWFLGAVGAAFAVGAQAHPHATYARVVEVEPIVDYVVVERPVRECWQETQYRPAEPGRVAAASVAGGLIGGVIGSSIGRNIGDGRSEGALLAAGALAGTAIAHDRAVDRQKQRLVAVPVERCAVSYDRVNEQRIRGYWVTYRYRGRLQRIRAHRHPGERIRLVATRGHGRGRF